MLLDHRRVGPALNLAVHPLERIRNRYEMGGADVRLGSQVPAYGATIRDRGTGSTKCGQADVLDELRARVSSWPPLRLARLRRERGSVGVVSPHAPVLSMDRRTWMRRVIGHGHPPHLRRGGGLGRTAGFSGRPGRHDPHGLEGFGKRLRASDEVVVEATGNAMSVVRVLSPFVAA